MAEIVVMPQLGNTVESCLVTAWHVSVGDTVAVNTVVADIETDKSAMEVPAGVAGTVLALLAQPGDEVPVKAPFLIVGNPGEDVSGLIAPKAEAAASEADASAPVWVDLSSEPQPPAEQGEPEAAASARPAPEPPMGGPASPRARRAAEEAGVDISQVRGTGPHGRILESDVSDFIASQGDGSSVSACQEPISTISDNEAAPRTPAEGPASAAQAAAGTTGPSHTRAVEAESLSGVEHGTGIGGRVTRQDVENARASLPEPAAVPTVPSRPAPAGVSEEDFPGPYTDTPLIGIRKIVADRMMASMAAHAQLTFDASASAEALLELRAKFKQSDPALGMSTVTVGDLVAYAAVRIASKFPSINATCENKILRCFENVHLGLAVDTPRGLLVPTIRYASSMSLKEFSVQTKALAAQARTGNINPDLLTGATFTVTNLGGFGIESFTPILNSPQTAILGVDTILPKPVIAPDGSVKVERRISFSLTVDHAVVDGAEAARFLQALTTFVSQIDLAILAEGGINA